MTSVRVTYVLQHADEYGNWHDSEDFSDEVRAREAYVGTRNSDTELEVRLIARIEVVLEEHSR
jgi:hypothetical protein